MEFKKSKLDDEQAVTLIEQATMVLKDFYEKTKLVQISSAKKQPAAGEAPPPPPSTFSEPYGGAKGESTGIIAILTLLKEDIEKDIEKAEKADERSQEDYEKQKGT